ncbi:MAG: hypothetical protein HQM08_26800 [Candidatus Riflebacteria bacterium]|nr:hypothetical protein [Candidatus Riflebacteria bacterium]
MDQIERQKSKELSKIKINVIGIGKIGIGAINRMILGNSHLETEEFKLEYIAFSTNSQETLMSNAPKNILLAENFSQLSGSTEIIEEYFSINEEDRKKINEIFKDAPHGLNIIVVALGSTISTNAALFVSNLAKKLGIFTIAFAIFPFYFEGMKRLTIAESGVKKLGNNFDSVAVVPCDKLKDLISEKNPKISEMTDFVFEILKRGVDCLLDIMMYSGLPCVDFQDVLKILKGGGFAGIGVGRAQGEGRATKATQEALKFPLLGGGLKEAKRIILNIPGDSNLRIDEIDMVCSQVQNAANDDVEIFFGSSPSIMDEGFLGVTIIAKK